jgi:RNA polymerase sigma factor for flagellar operon FliA
MAVTMYHMEDMRMKEIGQVLGLSESRVSRLLTAAELQLKSIVKRRNKS